VFAKIEAIKMQRYFWKRRNGRSKYNIDKQTGNRGLIGRE